MFGFYDVITGVTKNSGAKSSVNLWLFEAG